jgi:hypothetical protein
VTADAPGLIMLAVVLAVRRATVRAHALFRAISVVRPILSRLPATGLRAHSVAGLAPKTSDALARAVVVHGLAGPEWRFRPGEPCCDTGPKGNIVQYAARFGAAVTSRAEPARRRLPVTAPAESRSHFLGRLKRRSGDTMARFALTLGPEGYGADRDSGGTRNARRLR